MQTVKNLGTSMAFHGGQGQGRGKKERKKTKTKQGDYTFE